MLTLYNINIMAVKKTFYTILDHTADLRVKIKGNSMVNLFENAGYTLIDLMFDTRCIKKTETIEAEIRGIDLSDLMVRWLSEILYLFEGENLIVSGINIDNLTTNCLKSHLHTVKYNNDFHEVIMEIKAVTYHQIQVAENKGIWSANVIFDL